MDCLHWVFSSNLSHFSFLYRVSEIHFLMFLLNFFSIFSSPEHLLTFVCVILPILWLNHWKNELFWVRQVRGSNLYSNFSSLCFALKRYWSIVWSICDIRAILYCFRWVFWAGSIFCSFFIRVVARAASNWVIFVMKIWPFAFLSDFNSFACFWLILPKVPYCTFPNLPFRRKYHRFLSHSEFFYVCNGAGGIFTWIWS
jgi:hypothetical protein